MGFLLAGAAGHARSHAGPRCPGTRFLIPSRDLDGAARVAAVLEPVPEAELKLLTGIQIQFRSHSHGREQSEHPVSLSRSVVLLYVRDKLRDH